MLTDRSWRWLRTRILGLLTADTRLARQFAPPPDKTASRARGRAHD